MCLPTIPLVESKIASGQGLNNEEALQLYLAWQREKQIAEGAQIETRALRQSAVEQINVRARYEAYNEQKLGRIVNFIEHHRTRGARGWGNLVREIEGFARGEIQALPFAEG